ncbi:MAG: BrnA antitoxin family protein [Betaproteobacteria bacterium]
MSKPSSSKVSKTDWKRVDALRDEEIDLSDNPEVTPEMFAKAIVRRGLVSAPPKEQVTLRLDVDVLKWFRSQGKGYQTQINTLLRAYMEARRSK